jgi:DinB superfamily
MENQHKLIISEITKLLLGGSAHASLKDALAGLSPKLRGVKPENMPYSIWQLVEHIRIAQWDMLQFSKDADHKSPKWPDEYWPKESAPESESAWDGSLKQINDDLDEFIELVEHGDIYQELQHGDGQTILREALQMADHTAYHVAEIVALRRFLGDWKK